MGQLDEAAFTSFVGSAEPRLRQALCASFGAELGRDATAEALAWGWQNWSRLENMSNPVGYLYRVGRTTALREVGRRQVQNSIDDEALVWSGEMPDFEPSLAAFLAALSERQRVCVWMVHGLGFAQTEVAEVLECAPESVATHVRRALHKLRTGLEVDSDV